MINHKNGRDGSILYLVKWRDLPYDQATWEAEADDIPGLKVAIDYYMVNFCFKNILNILNSAWYSTTYS